MKIPLRKVVSLVLLTVFIPSNFSIVQLYAKSDQDTNGGNTQKTEKIATDHNLKDTFSGKKLERLKASIKGKNSYKLLIRSTDNIDAISSSFGSDKKIKVKKVGNGSYMVRIPLDTTTFSGELQKLDNGIIPSKLASYDVVQPDIFEALWTEYLTGETVNKLWSMQKIGAPGFVEDLATKEKIKVWVLDTGIDSTHMDLADNYDTSLSYDFVNDKSGSIDDNGHGTEVAGVIGARVNGKWVFWVDPNADLVSLKVLGADGIGTTYDVLDAIAYAKTNHIPVLNVSFGGTGNPVGNPICDAITDAKNAGTVTVVSAGNANQDAGSTIPAACPDAITVGAVDHNDTKASFSNYGDVVDVYAPGTDVYTTALNNGYTTQNGTSFSAPLVAGIVAKEIGYNSGITYDALVSNIKSNYHLVTNGTLWNGSTAGTGSLVSSGTTASTGSISLSGITSTGMTLSGATLSGATQVSIIDYSTYHYYSGTFVQSGMTYGNSLYPDSLGFQSLNLKGVQVYGYDEYMKMLKTKQGMFQTLSAPANWLIWEWKLDGNANDTSGYGHNGVPSNVSWTWGKIGGWGLFSGNGGIYFSGNIWLEPANITFSTWIKFAGDNGIQMIMDSSHAFLWVPSGWVMQTRWDISEDAFEFSLWNSRSWWECMGTLNVSDHQWHLITGSYDQSNIRLYVDWVLQNTLAYPGWYTPTNAPIEIGHWWVNNGWRYFSGSLDNMRVYNRALSASEVMSLYNEWFEPTINTSTTLPILSLDNYLTSIAYGSTAAITQTNNTLIASAAPNGDQNMLRDAADPVNLANGEFTYSNTFMQIPGVKNPYEFSLTYRNQLPYDGPVGNKFDHNYNMFLVESTGAVNFFNGKLGVFNFPQASTGTGYDYNKGLKAKLSKDSTSGLYALTFDNGTRYLFGANLKVSKMTDRYGNALVFAYNADKQLTTVTDTLGRDVTYTYNSDTRLQKVTESGGRSVKLSYFASGDTGGGANDLKSVTIKSGTDSKTISYTYDANHNIATLTDSKGQVYVNNTFDANGRVTSQKYGTGTVNYVYTLTGSTAPGASAQSVYQNDVTNANGVHTQYTYDSNENTVKREIFDSVGTGSTVYSYAYDTNARLQKSTLPKGNGTSYQYDARGNITMERQKTSAKAADNNTTDLVTTYQYDGVFDVPVKVTLPNGLVKTFTLDGSGNVLSQTASGILNPDGTSYATTLGYSYDSIGQLIQKTDGEGNTTSYTYASGQLVSVTQGTGSTAIQETFNYDAYGNLVSSTDGEGKTKFLTYNPFNLVANSKTAEGIETRFTYDANNNKTREEKYTLADGVIGATDYTYDNLDHVTWKTEKIDGTHSRVTAMDYDGNGNVLDSQEGTGAVVQYAYDEMNRVKTKSVIVDPLVSTSNLVTTNTYDRNGNMTRTTDPLNRSTSFTYDLFDRVTRKTDALGNYTTYAYDKTGNILEVKSFDKLNVLLQRTTNDYDLLGHVIRSTVYDLTNTTPGNMTTTTKHDRNGNILEKTDPKGTVSRYSYDSFGRPTQSTDALGNQTTLTYDKRSLVTVKSITSSGSSYALSTTLEYDGDGRLVKQTDAAGKTKKYTYSGLGQTIKTEDENGHVITMTYDSLGQLLSEKKTLTDSGNIDVVTSYQYDILGNLTALTDPNGNTNIYQYDVLNRKVKEILPDGKSSLFVYDKNSNLTKVTDPNGTITTNAYDALNRVSKRTITPASKQVIKGTSAESYIYDALGRLSGATSTGVLSPSAQTIVNTLAFAYDSQNRLLSETENGTTVSYAYDINGNRTGVASGTGYLVGYSYDILSRLTGVGYNSGNIANYSYSGTMLDRMSLGNGVTTSYTYDSLLRFSALNHTNASGSIASRNYTYDPASNLLSDGQKSYTYDSIDRLTGAFALSGVTVPSLGETFAYDATGNRTASTQNNVSTSYSGNILNQYLSATSLGTATGSDGGGYPLTYDSGGNLTSNGVFTFGYDYKNRLVFVKKASDSSVVAQYVYDALGRRIQKWTPSTRTDYVYAGENAILEMNTNIAKNIVSVTDRVYGNGTDDLLGYETDDTTLASSDTPEYVFCLSRVLPYVSDFEKYGWMSVTSRCNTLGNAYNTTQRKFFYIQKDHLGSSIALTDASGSVVQSYAYDTYGTPYVSTGTGFTAIRDFVGNLHGNDRFYTGREYEGSVGLYYYRARFYSPELGRFISRDPIGMSDDVNLYGYVKESPMMGVDPDGSMVKQAVVSSAQYVGAAAYTFVDNQSFGLINKALNSTIGTPSCDTDACQAGQNSGDRLSYAVNATIIAAWVTWGAAGTMSITIWIPTCLATAGGGCAWALVWTAVNVGSTAAIGYGSAGELYMAAKSGSSGWPTAWKKFTPNQREATYGRDWWKCTNCWVDTHLKWPSSPNKAETDHIIPKSRWGNTTEENAQNLCRTCNRQKGASTMEEFLNFFLWK